MIPNSELRLGDWVMHTTSKTVMQAKLICPGNSYYDPIPLTPTWVLDFGFIQDSAPWKDGEIKFDEYRLGPLTLHTVGGTPNMWQISYYNHMLQVFIYSVHQLQNLYFIFTGEELKRKIK